MNRTILIDYAAEGQTVMTYTYNEIMEIYTLAQRQALAGGESIRVTVGKRTSTHTDLVAYYNRTQG